VVLRQVAAECDKLAVNACWAMLLLQPSTGANAKSSYTVVAAHPL
jgi:hypothetical protein